MSTKADTIITAAEHLALALSGVRELFAGLDIGHPAYAELSLLSVVLERAEDLAGDILSAARTPG
jgi:hypothetical protein